MRLFFILGLGFAISSAASPALTQNPWQSAATVEQAVARAIDDAMPDTRYPWGLGWSGFGVRGGRDIFWHLTPPLDQPAADLPQGIYRRTGWLTVNGRTGAVALCGDADRIDAMAVSMADMWLGEADVIEELAARGVGATLLQSREASPPAEDLHPSDLALLRARPAFQQWSLEKEGREPVQLSAVHACTPPGTRHATHCWVVWRVVFQPEDPGPGAECPLPGRHGHG